jgi:polyphosphate kinase 2 (PPK2 family)
LNLLTQKLEPRGFRLHAIQAPRTYETHMPWLWRFWLKMPNYGQIAIFDKSWHRRVLDDRVGKLASKREWEKAYLDITGFERSLADDGYVVRKFFFHITKKEQKKRFEKSERDPLRAWHVASDWWERHRKYGKYAEAVEDMLAKTDAEWAPWTIVEATDRRWARVKVFDTIAGALEGALKTRGLEIPPPPPANPEAVTELEAVLEPNAKPDAKAGRSRAKTAKRS